GQHIHPGQRTHREGAKRDECGEILDESKHLHLPCCYNVLIRSAFVLVQPADRQSAAAAANRLTRRYQRACGQAALPAILAMRLHFRRPAVYGTSSPASCAESGCAAWPIRHLSRRDRRPIAADDPPPFPER